MKQGHSNYLFKILVLPTNKGLFNILCGKNYNREAFGVRFLSVSYKSEVGSFKNQYWVLNPDKKLGGFKPFYLRDGVLALIVSNDLSRDEDKIKNIAYKLNGAGIELINVGGVNIPTIDDLVKRNSEAKEFLNSTRPLMSDFEKYGLKAKPEVLYSLAEKMQKRMEQICPSDALNIIEDGKEVYTIISNSLIIYDKHPLLSEETMIDKVLKFDLLKLDDVLKELTIVYIKRTQTG